MKQEVRGDTIKFVGNSEKILLLEISQKLITPQQPWEFEGKKESSSLSLDQPLNFCTFFNHGNSISSTPPSFFSEVVL